MNKKEVANLLRKIDTFYPGRLKVDNIEEVVKTWYEVLKDSDYELSDKKMMEYVKGNKFPPSISELIAEVPVKKELTEEQKKNIRIRELKDTIRLTRDYYAMTKEEHLYDAAVKELEELEQL